MARRNKQTRRRGWSVRRVRRWWRRWSPFASGLVVGGIVVGLALGWWFSRSPSQPVSRGTRESRGSESGWSRMPPADFPIPPYSRFLDGVRIVLDPGHIGQRDPGGNWKRGPTGLREAEVNLRVAGFLSEFLRTAGAQVWLTRSEDRNLDLADEEDVRDRADFANRAEANLLLSIHHNAGSDPASNYTAVFYHPGNVCSAASVCAARYLVAGLNDSLRLSTHLECPVLSDRVMYPNGLGVLRQAEVPAVLTEASFFTNPAEEARLRDPEYNRREAYGLFLGLARWAQAGLPSVQLVEVRQGSGKAGGEAVVSLDDGLRGRGGWGADQLSIPAESVLVRLDGKEARHTLDQRGPTLRITLPRGLRAGAHTLVVDFANALGQHVLHPRLDFDYPPR